MNEPAAPTELLAQWLAISADLLASTDRHGCIVWGNPAFRAASGLSEGDALPPVLHAADDVDDGSSAVAGALAGTPLVDALLQLLPAGGGALRWLSVRTGAAAGVEGRILWALRDVTADHARAQRERALAERLEIAQEFGRLGIWEHRFPSGETRWDRHMFSFWGLDPGQPAPTVEQALQRVHPDDRAAVAGDLETTTRAGRYARRYRVLHPDGVVRFVHSQWEVKASPAGVPQRAVGITVDDTEVYQLARSRDAAALRLKLTADLANIVHWRHEFATDLMHYNRHGFAVLGMPPRHRGIPLAELRALTHPDDLPRVAASAERALATGLPDDAEARYRHGNGSWRNLLMRRLLQRAEDGTPTGFVGVSLDITEQLQRGREADELARRLESVADAADIGIWSHDPLTGAGHWNRQMYQLTGRPPELGVPTLDQWLEQIVHPADRERMRGMPAAFSRASARPVQIEYRILRPDGQTRWMENRYRLDDREGQRLIVGVKLDITERRAAEEALRSADRRAALAARSAGIGTWEVDFDPALQVEAERWDEQMFRLRGLEPADKPPGRAARLALVHPDDASLTVDASGERLASDAPLSYEFRLLLADGSVRWLASRSIAVRDGTQPVRRRVGVNWDVTESKTADITRQEKALAEHENRAKSQFLSRMSHELRTPLNAVLGFAELLHVEASHANAADQLAKLGHIRAAGEHLLGLINDVLELSRLESDAPRRAAQQIGLADLVAETLPLVEPLARRHGVTLHGASPAAVVLGDRRRLRQVLINLLSNAIKYNHPGGDVWLEADQLPPVPGSADGQPAGGNTGSTVLLRVRDNGRGLSPQQLAHLFEPFNRLGVERESIEGSGIGLVIVKTLVEGMNGTVTARSEPAAGTVFELRLPGPAGAPKAPPAPAASPGGFSFEPSALHAPERLAAVTGQLLYIEDNPVNVLLLEELVAHHTGLAIASEVTGAAGVARSRELQPDLVLVDMQLPDFDGYEVLRQLRADPATAGLRCIALSANAMAEDIERALAAGFIAYWTKPIDFTAFLAALRSLLAPPPEAAPGGERR